MDGEEAVRYILRESVEGCIVECGVDAGDFEYRWIQELQRHGQERDLYMFDTFKGLTEPGEFDYTASTATLYTMNKETVHKEWSIRCKGSDINTWCYTPIDAVKQRLESTGYPKERLHYVEGDVCQTLTNPANIPDKIAILRLDTDWYESSKVELEVLFPKVVRGGVVIFDDYYHWDGQRRATDEYFAKQGIHFHMVDIGNHKTGAFIKQ